MAKNNDKKADQLGMPLGTAANRLRKQILFDVTVEHKINVCLRCDGFITTVDEFSLDHIEPWLDSNDPTGKFFDRRNVGFAHLACNVAAGRKAEKKHPSISAYRRGCRCDECLLVSKATNKRGYARSRRSAE